MPRSYTHIKVLEKEIFEQKAQGKCNRQIREQYGLSKIQMRNLITRHNRAEIQIKAGIITRRRGRPPKGYKASDNEKDNVLNQVILWFGAIKENHLKN